MFVIVFFIYSALKRDTIIKQCIMSVLATVREANIDKLDVDLLSPNDFRCLFIGLKKVFMGTIHWPSRIVQKKIAFFTNSTAKTIEECFVTTQRTVCPCDT